MKNIKKIILFIAGVLMLSLTSYAQQQMLYTQFANNRFAVNPAYAGLSEGLINANIMSRWQWTGIEGAPRTSTLSLDGKLPGHNVGLGLMVSNDQVAITGLTNVQATYAYHINFSENTTLSVGISGALINYRANYAEAFVLQNGDPDFAANVSEMGANFGTGLYFIHKNLWAGFSSPTILDNTFGDSQNAEFTLRRHYYLMGGYKFKLSRNTTLMPSFLFRTVRGGAWTIDINTLVEFHEVLAVGAGYRDGESVSMILQLKPTDFIRFGYSYDHIISDELNGFANNSHEALIAVTIPKSKRKKAKIAKN